MTIEELADTLDIGSNYLKNQWQYIVQSRLNQGIELIKIGRGKNADYGYKTLKDEFYIFEYTKKG